MGDGSSIEAELAQSQLDLAAERLHSEHLEAALRSSRQIGMAMGITMERYRIPEDRAFDLLRRLSQDLNRKVADIAGDIVATGELPAAADDRLADR